MQAQGALWRQTSLDAGFPNDAGTPCELECKWQLCSISGMHYNELNSMSHVASLQVLQVFDHHSQACPRWFKTVASKGSVKAHHSKLDLARGEESV